MIADEVQLERTRSPNVPMETQILNEIRTTITK